VRIRNILFKWGLEGRIKRSNQKIESEDRIRRSNQKIESEDRIRRSNQKIKSEDRIRRSNQKIESEDQKFFCIDQKIENPLLHHLEKVNFFNCNMKTNLLQLLSEYRKSYFPSFSEDTNIFGILNRRSKRP